MVGWERRRTVDLLLFFNGVMLAIVLTQLASLYFFRIDLTGEKRFTIKEPTVTMLRGLADDVYIDVFLDGDLNAEFRRLRKAIRETLEEFRMQSGNKVQYRFSDPMAAKGANAQQAFMADLVSRGLKPMNIIESQDGRRSEKIVFPGALISYGGFQTGVMLLKDQVSQGSREDLNRAIEGLEFELASAIHQLTNNNRKRIGFVTGHGELDSSQVASLREGLLPFYDVGLRANLNRRAEIDLYDVLILAKPQAKFTELEKYVLDQYVLRGGKLVMMLDAVRAEMDSISRNSDYYGFPVSHGLDDLLFQYGVRVNSDLVQDRVSLRYPIVTGVIDGRPQITPMEWPYFPLANQYADHPVTRNLDAAVFRFVSSMDTVKARGIRKTPIIFSSNYARKVGAPLKINVNDLRKEMNPENFSGGPFPLAYLLEGSFTSLFKNRFLPDGVDSTGSKTTGVPTRLIVIADGDFARNDINRRTGQSVELGFDVITNHTFANSELLLNMIAYLTDDSGLIVARNKEVMARPLDKERVRESRISWQILNVVMPLLLMLALGAGKVYLRQKKYARFATSLNHGEQR